eukprot:TRINITY_DN13838_c0_g1_i2.p1 TRINITY_DN13838_c0_g1~~TRINITY_DN13838_c0_g1_i2.p1  ORF type:complete len:384 (+),score=54.80 TRINITY_DN13838_c0_g1_i2:59-1210(+)
MALARAKHLCRQVGRLRTRTGTAFSKQRGSNKIRVGFIVGKNFDPIPQGTHDRAYPQKLRMKKNTGPSASGWGGMFHIDVSVALRMARKHPSIFYVDVIKGHDVSVSRLRQNHINFNLHYDVVMARYEDGKARARYVKSLFRNPACRMWPSFDYYDWVCTKSRYMKQCLAAGIPMIDTMFVENGINPKGLLKAIQDKGWPRFFIKSASYTCFSNATMHGSTEDLAKDLTPLQAYAKENADTCEFLVQPYTLKPNGNVFDEIRNFFIDGEWAYSVYTDGTDDNAVYEMPQGAQKDAARSLAEQVFEQVMKVSKWQGKPMAPLLCRVDVGVVPDASKPQGFRVFMNEIETEISTWLARYCPFNLADAVAEGGLVALRRRLTVVLI